MVASPAQPLLDLSTDDTRQHFTFEFLTTLISNDLWMDVWSFWRCCSNTSYHLGSDQSQDKQWQSGLGGNKEWREVGIGTTDEDRARYIKRKRGEKKERGGWWSLNQGPCLSNLVWLSSWLVINEVENAICFPWEFLLSGLGDCSSLILPLNLCCSHCTYNNLG